MFTKLIFKRFDRELINTIILGLVFMFVYSAFYTISNVEKVILNSVQLEKVDYNGSAFVSLSIWYVTFALFLWIVPPVIRFTGITLAVTLGAIGYSLFLASFLVEVGWVLYLGSVCNGFGAALLWTCQGCYNILNSTPQTLTRNAAIFSGFTHSSTLYGNLIVYFTFLGKESIDYSTRTIVVSVLLGLSVVGLIVSLTLSAPAYARARAAPLNSAAQAFRQSWQVVYNKHMLMLCPMFVYCGLEASFFTGVVGAAVGFTLPAEIVPLYGFFTGVGGILADVCLVLVNPVLSARPKLSSLVVIVSVCCDYVGFLLLFLSFTNGSIFSLTNESAIISSSSWLTAVIGTLLGFADGIFLPLLISMIGKLNPRGGASVVTLHTFCFSFASAVSFFYSSYVGLHWQLLILLLQSMLGVSCFCYIIHDVNSDK